MTTSRFDGVGARFWGILGAIALLVIGVVVFRATPGNDGDIALDKSLVQAFGVTWEMREIEWREAEGLHGVRTELHPFRGSGTLPDTTEAIGNGLCGAVLSALPKDAPVKHRRDVFRVRVKLPTLTTDGVTPDFFVNVIDGACNTIVRSGNSMMSYPGLAPDWVLSEWKADDVALDGFKVVFRRTNDAPLNSLNLELACRAALFDLPSLLGEHLDAFKNLSSIQIVAEAGVGGGWFRFSRSLAWNVPINEFGCGEAVEIET